MRTSFQKNIPILRVLLFFVLLLILFPIEVYAIFNAIGNMLGSALLDAANGFFALCIKLFLFVIQYTILDFADFWTTDLGLQPVWQTVRDIVNLLIVVFFILTAITTLFGNWERNKKILLGLLAVALLVNFSAFFVLALFDISNALFIAVLSVVEIEHLMQTGLFTTQEGLDGVFESGLWRFLYQTIGAITTFFVSFGFVWFAILLIERFILAILLVISSPLAFLGFFTKEVREAPGVKMIAQFFETWQDMFRRALLTPVMLIFGFLIIFNIFATANNKILKDNASNTEAFLVELCIVSIVFIFGIFYVGRIVSSIKIGKFEIGKHLRKFVSPRGAGIVGRASFGIARNVAGMLPAGRVSNTLGKIAQKTGVGVGAGAFLGRTFRNLNRTGKAYTAVAKDVLGGKKITPEAKKGIQELRATRNEQRERWSDVVDGTYDEKMKLAKSSGLLDREVRHLKENGFGSTLAANDTLSAAQLNILKQGLKKGNEKGAKKDEATWKAIANNKNTSTRTLKKITDDGKLDIAIRNAARENIQKQSVYEPAKLDEKEQIKSINGTISYLKENDKERNKENEELSGVQENIRQAEEMIRNLNTRNITEPEKASRRANIEKDIRRMKTEEAKIEKNIEDMNDNEGSYVDVLNSYAGDKNMKLRSEIVKKVPGDIAAPQYDEMFEKLVKKASGAVINDILNQSQTMKDGGEKGEEKFKQMIKGAMDGDTNNTGVMNTVLNRPTVPRYQAEIIEKHPNVKPNMKRRAEKILAGGGGSPTPPPTTPPPTTPPPTTTPTSPAQPPGGGQPVITDIGNFGQEVNAARKGTPRPGGRE